MTSDAPQSAASGHGIRPSHCPVRSASSAAEDCDHQNPNTLTTTSSWCEFGCDVRLQNRRAIVNGRFAHHQKCARIVAMSTSSAALTPDDLLTTTRSVRKRLDLTRPVERAVLEECVRIAQQAPTASKRGELALRPRHRHAASRAARGAVSTRCGRLLFESKRTAQPPAAGARADQDRRAAAFAPAPRRPVESVIHWEHW
jgi:hypothetical protein